MCNVPYLLNAWLQTTGKPSWETKTIFHKQSLATDPKSVISSWFSLLFNPSDFLLPNSLFFSSYFTIQTTLKHSLYLPCVTLKFLPYLFICSLTHIRPIYKVSCFCYGSSRALFWLVEPDTENNNEQLGMTNSVWGIPPHQLSLAITVSVFVSVFVCMQPQCKLY